MTTHGFWRGFIAVGLVVSSITTGVAWLKHRRAEADLAGVSARSAELRHAVAQARRAQAEAERLGAEQAREVRQLEAAIQARAPQPATEPSPPDEGLILARDAVLRAKFERLVRRDVDEKYGSLFRQWRLSPEKIDALCGLMMRDAESALDLRGAAGAQGVDVDHPGAMRLRTRQFEELLAAEKALLAPDEYHALQLRQRVESVRDGVDGLAALLFSFAPLDAVQGERLAQALAEASRTYQAGGRATWDTIDWARVLARAPSFLSEPQVEQVRGYARLWQLTAEQMNKIFPELSPGR